MKSNKERFAKAFYSHDAISGAIKDYSKLASISCVEEGEYYVCTFPNCITDSQRIVNEFNNYLIELMNARGDRAEA